MSTGKENPDSLIETRMTDLLFQNTALAQGIALINGLTVYLILFQYVENYFLPAWLIAVLVISVLRMVIAKLYWRRRKISRPPAQLLVVFLFATYISALTWGMLIKVIPEDILWMEAFTAFVIAGMSAGSLITNSARLNASVPYIVLILIFLPFHYADNGDPPHLAMAVMVTLYMFLMIRLAFRVQDMQYRSNKSELENTELYNILKRAKQDTDEMRESLREKIDELPAELAYLDVFFDLTPDLLCITDINGRLVMANPAILEVMNVDSDDYKSRTLFSFLHDDDITGLKSRLEELRKDQDEERCTLHLRYGDNRYHNTDFHIVYRNDMFYFAGRESI